MHGKETTQHYHPCLGQNGLEAQVEEFLILLLLLPLLLMEKILEAIVQGIEGYMLSLLLLLLWKQQRFGASAILAEAIKQVLFLLEALRPHGAGTQEDVLLRDYLRQLLGCC